MLIRRTLHLCLRKLPWFHYFIPHFQADIARLYPWIPFCFRACSGFFASSLAIIRLNKLSTLSLRSFPPLNPFERRDQPTDTLDSLGRTQGPNLLASIRYVQGIPSVNRLVLLTPTVSKLPRI
ncbi:MAG: hypothetical protein CL932_15045 [Deltaproteobacteria bacterium]|nr:hypothetical protein [Deltaproteobacteria bacterium]